MWTAAVLLALTGYVASAPFVAFLASKYGRAAEPVLMVVYAPLIYVSRTPDAPGHDLLIAYLRFAESFFRK
ncbi:MAG: hypothetical protein U0992_15705 [Planctomycetaceae bacterium]